MRATESVSVPAWVHRLRDAVLLLEETGAIVWANPGAELLLGRSAVELRECVLWDLLEDSDMAAQLGGDLMDSMEDEFACVVDFKGVEGLSLPMELTFFRDLPRGRRTLIAHPHVEDGTEAERLAIQARQLSDRLTGFQNQVHELSEELLDKTVQLAEEKNKMEAVLSSMGEGLLVVDTEGRIAQINEMACRILEIDPDEALGKILEQSPIATKLPSIATLVQTRMAASGAREPGSSRLEFQEKVIEFSLATIEAREADELGGGAVLNIRDVTRQAEVDRMKTELISIVSHELRSPLANITGYLDLVLTDTAASLPGEQRNFIEVAQKNSVKLSNLVDDMLDLSRLESGKIEMDLGEVDAEYLVNSTHLSFKNEAEAKQIAFEKNIEGNSKIHGDSDRLQQVLNNLVGNAIKYTSEGGKVRIDCKELGKDVAISIGDSGIGIREEDQQKLFQRFFRVRSSETRKIRGTGLGLSIAKTIVDAHRGRLTVHSEHGKGSVFTVTLPASRP